MIIDYWEIQQDSSPVLDFISGEPPKAGAKIQKIIDFFADQGMSLLGTQYLEKIENTGLYELRIVFCGIAYRILMYIKGEIAHLIHAFKKKTKKTPLAHIKTALERKHFVELQYAFAG